MDNLPSSDQALDTLLDNTDKLNTVASKILQRVVAIVAHEPTTTDVRHDPVRIDKIKQNLQQSAQLLLSASEALPDAEEQRIEPTQFTYEAPTGTLTIETETVVLQSGPKEIFEKLLYYQGYSVSPSIFILEGFGSHLEPKDRSAYFTRSMKSLVATLSKYGAENLIIHTGRTRASEYELNVQDTITPIEEIVPMIDTQPNISENPEVTQSNTDIAELDKPTTDEDKIITDTLTRIILRGKDIIHVGEVVREAFNRKLSKDEFENLKNVMSADDRIYYMGNAKYVVRNPIQRDPAEAHDDQDLDTKLKEVNLFHQSLSFRRRR